MRSRIMERFNQSFQGSLISKSSQYIDCLVSNRFIRLTQSNCCQGKGKMIAQEQVNEAIVAFADGKQDVKQAGLIEQRLSRLETTTNFHHRPREVKRFIEP